MVWYGMVWYGMVWYNMIWWYDISGYDNLFGIVCVCVCVYTEKHMVGNLIYLCVCCLGYSRSVFSTVSRSSRAGQRMIPMQLSISTFWPPVPKAPSKTRRCVAEKNLDEWHGQKDMMQKSDQLTSIWRVDRRAILSGASTALRNWTDR